MAHADDFCAKFVKDIGRHMVGRAMCGIDHQSKTTQGQLGRKAAFTELNVATCRIRQTTGLAQHLSISTDQWLFKGLLNFKLHGVRQFFALTIKELNAVVFKKVVRGTNNNSGR